MEEPDIALRTTGNPRKLVDAALPAQYNALERRCQGTRVEQVYPDDICLREPLGQRVVRGKARIQLVTEQVHDIEIVPLVVTADVIDFTHLTILQDEVNASAMIFHKESDFAAFEQILAEVDAALADDTIPGFELIDPGVSTTDEMIANGAS